MPVTIQNLDLGLTAHLIRVETVLGDKQRGTDVIVAHRIVPALVRVLGAERGHARLVQRSDFRSGWRVKMRVKVEVEGEGEGYSRLEPP